MDIKDQKIKKETAEDLYKDIIFSGLVEYFRESPYNYTFYDRRNDKELTKKHVFFEVLRPDGVLVKCQIIVDSQIGQGKDKQRNFLIEHCAHVSRPDEKGWMHLTEADVIFVYDYNTSLLYSLNWTSKNIKDYVVSNYNIRPFGNKKDEDTTEAYFIPIKTAENLGFVPFTFELTHNGLLRMEEHQIKQHLKIKGVMN